MKEQILEFLKTTDTALSALELGDALKLTGAEDLRQLLICLGQMEKEGSIYHSHRDKYLLIENSHLKKGILHVNKKGFGFVDIPNREEDVYIGFDNMNGAIHGDVVLVELLGKKDAVRLEGRILKIIERKMDQFIGEIYFKKGIGYIKLDDPKVKLDIEIPKKRNLNAVNGHKVVVRILGSIGNHRYQGEVVKILGHIDDPGVDILSIVYKYNINDQFPDAVQEQVSKMPDEVAEEEMVGRRDLRNEVIFTIDGNDTKDIDDAISIKKLDNGNYELGVHIADVSYYVREGSPLDEEAMERGTSVYLVDRVIPMLPHELSNGICSLNPGVARLAMSCVMEINELGKVVTYDIYESVIQSKIQMTYETVNKILAGEEAPTDYAPYVRELEQMKELSQILRKMKLERGYLDFDVDEAKILVDETGHPTDIVLRDRGVGENMIEDFMIAANECVATHIFYMDLPFLYRIHETPKEEKIREYLSFLGTLGYQLTGNLKDTSPKTLQKILSLIKDSEQFKILSSLLLRNMQKAIYQPENIGHYGLASKCYTHFTSPIRRYPDTTVHRLLRTYLFENKMDSATRNHWSEKLPFVTEHSSSKERASIECEREVEDMKMAEYMEDHIGEEFEGMISSVLSFGMFIQLDNLIEGLVPVKEMDDFYHYDELNLRLTGEKNHIQYTIGDRVVVKVVRASKTEKTIDFQIVRKVD